MILIVDDQKDSGTGLERLLHYAGHEAVSVTGGAEALAMLHVRKPALLVLDVNMPEMDGYRTTMEIRKMPEPWCNLPIIALTADAMKGDREKCLEAGMNKYISKPFKLEEIDEVLRSYLLVV